MVAFVISAASGKTDELDATQQNKMNRDYSNAPAHTRQSVQKLLVIGTTTNDVGKAPVLTRSLNGFQWGVVGDGKTTLSSSVFYTATFASRIRASDGVIVAPLNEGAVGASSFDNAIKVMLTLPSSAVLTSIQKSGTANIKTTDLAGANRGVNPASFLVTIVSVNSYRIGYRTIIPSGTLP